MFMFLPATELKKTDEFVARLCLKDQVPELYRFWANNAEVDCFLFLVNTYLYARGDKASRAYAKGFITGWRSALGTNLVPDKGMPFPRSKK